MFPPLHLIDLQPLRDGPLLALLSSINQRVTGLVMGWSVVFPCVPPTVSAGEWASAALGQPRPTGCC